MNAGELLAHYERVADAPDSVARLRRFVLDLAVRGKLVEQDPADEPASELLRRIADEKARLVKAGEIRKPKRLTPLSLDQLAFPLPRSWNWAQLGEVTTKLTDGSHNPPPNSGSGYPMLSSRNVLDGFVDFESPTRFLTAEQMEEEDKRTKACSGDVLLTIVGTIGRSAVVPENAPRFALQRSVAVITPLINADYLSLVLRSPVAHEYFLEYGKGTAQKGIYLKKLANLPLPFPSLAEQHRIVAKVDELMALCDRLEAAREAREATRDRLTAASLARLNAPDPDPSTFANHARLALDNLDPLTTRPDQIKQLRQTILNLAVRGKLSDEPGGAMAKVGDYRKLQNGYAFKSGWFSKSGIRLLRNANVGHGSILWNDVAYLPEDRVPEFERFLLAEGDIVLTLDRPFIVSGTKVARVTSDDLPSLLLQRVGRFVEIRTGLSEEYLFNWINSPHFNEQIDPGRSNGVPHISSKQVEAAEMFVPSLAEQRRIVAKVDELMALCDRLEAALAEADTTRQHLLEALLHEALAPGARELEAAE